MQQFPTTKSGISPAGENEPGEMRPDFDAIMQANLLRVFSERDPERRLVAIRDIYAPDAVLFEPGTSAEGHDAISRAVSDLLSHMPPDFGFRPVRPALGHHGVGRLQWTGGPADGSPVVTGLDVAHVEGGMIRSLHVFLDQSAQ